MGDASSAQPARQTKTVAQERVERALHFAVIMFPLAPIPIAAFGALYPGASMQHSECLQTRYAEMHNDKIMYEWSDLKIFLATVRAHSMLGAAAELGINQSTVARRITALEAALDIRLFDRTRDGCRLNEAGKSLLSQAERVAAEAESFERLVTQRKRD